MVVVVEVVEVEVGLVVFAWCYNPGLRC